VKHRARMLAPQTHLEAKHRLDAMEDDDDIEWKEDPFDRPHRAEPESPEELLAMIQFEGTPHRFGHSLQE
jgi:hypothetical protein